MSLFGKKETNQIAITIGNLVPNPTPTLLERGDQNLPLPEVESIQ
jgi:hypothetical protein